MNEKDLPLNPYEAYEKTGGSDMKPIGFCCVCGGEIFYGDIALRLPCEIDAQRGLICEICVDKNMTTIEESEDR